MSEGYDKHLEGSEATGGEIKSGRKGRWRSYASEQVLMRQQDQRIVKRGMAVFEQR